MEKKSDSWVTILVLAFMLVLAVCGWLLWQFLPAAVAPPRAAAGPSSGPGFEVRYNAIVALANRGSRLAVEASPEAAAQAVGLLAAPGGFAQAVPVIQADDRQALLLEMLDEERQLRNFRIKLQGGQDQPDGQAAQTTVVSTLKALAELRRRQPDLELSRFQPAIDRLTQSANPLIQQEAVKTQLAIKTAS